MTLLETAGLALALGLLLSLFASPQYLRAKMLDWAQGQEPRSAENCSGKPILTATSQGVV